MKRNRNFAVLLCAMLLLISTAAAQVSTWDAARDFTGAQNPNGPWAYAWKATGSSGVTRFPTYEPVTQDAARDAWQDLNQSSLLGVYHNAVGFPGDMPSSTLLLQPDPLLGKDAVLEWTATADEFVHVQGMFRNLDASAAQVSVASSASGQRFSAIALPGGSDASFALFLHVTAGERIDFAASGGAAAVNAVISRLNLVGNSAVMSLSPTDTRFRVTSNANNQVGGGWTVTKQRLADGFSTDFQFQISQLAGGGADGFAFVIQNSSATALDGAGGSLGYDGVASSLAIEFDTFLNSALSDPNSNHISVHTQGIHANSSMESASIGRTTSIPNLKDGNWHHVRVQYLVQPQPELMIYIDNSSTPVLQIAVDIVSTLQLADGSAWVGFTGGTGGSTEVHDIQDWHFESSDAHAPELSLPADMTLEGMTKGGAQVNYAATALDVVDGPRPITCAPASGALFPVGQTTVHCSSTDLSGNNASGSFAVTVTDTTPPMLTVPLSVTAAATSSNGAAVSFLTTATDIVDGDIVPVCSPATGSTFPLGKSSVTCAATDQAGNRASKDFDVEVKDEVPPVITGAANLVVEATGTLTSVEWKGVTASDDIDGSVAVACDAASGSQFPIGKTAVQCSAADKAGNKATASFTVTVQDTMAPVVVCGAADGLWHAADAAISCTASDSGSGLADASNASFVLGTSVAGGTESSNAATGSRTICDGSGNCATAGPIAGNRIDKRAPSITISAPAGTTYILNQPINAAYSCADGGSGVASCTGTVANGAALDTASVGARQFTVHASDNVGNAAVASAGYSVGYNLCLLSSTEAKQSGSAIPVRVALCDYAGKNVSSAAVDVVAVGIVGPDRSGPAQSAGNANANGRFRFIAGGAYMFDLKTSGLTPGVYQLLVRVTGDATPHALPFAIRER